MGKLHRPHHIPQVILNQHDIRRFDGDISPRPQGNTYVGTRQGRRIINPVAYHGHPHPLFLQCAYLRSFFFRKHLGKHPVYAAINPHTGAILIAASLFLLASEREIGRILLAAFVFLLAGALGAATMQAGVEDSLFPAFSGLFAASGILLSFTSKKSVPPQEGGKTKLDFIWYVAAGVLLGALSDLLPGMAAPAQIAIFASVFIVSDDARKFLALIASIAASHAVFAFAALVSIGKAREGALAVLNGVAPVNAGDLPVLAGVLLLSIGVSAFLLLRLAKHADRLQKFGMKSVNLGILAYLLCAVAIISGGEGLLVFATATAIGLLPPLLGIRRTHVMGLIIVPSILLAL